MFSFHSVVHMAWPMSIGPRDDKFNLSQNPQVKHAVLAAHHTAQYLLAAHYTAQYSLAAHHTAQYSLAAHHNAQC